ncbi:MAG: diadenylate cyclase CdaA [Deltaproteobacteria bacterium]|nr:diadenylate cyclase CdaA [Deltaproteobacteria bacterium]
MADFFANILASGNGGFSAAVDLFIVFYIVYTLLLLIRGTRTVPMALGLFIIIVVHQLSRVFGLATTYELLNQFMDVVVIFALIIFQDDIRRALVRMGRFAWFSKAQETQVVEEVIRAATNLASRKIGAIVVFERDASLDEFIEEGTPIDAAVTKELIYSIFIPLLENPLHDGAIIIRNYRIAKAGALLPLSSKPGLDKNLGTRHRAAMGITEQTDAVSVVVSEERGTISLCFAGKISKNLDVASLRRALLNLFSKEKAREKRKAAIERKTATPAPPAGGSTMPDEREPGGE